jgi:hypothetical protein
LPSVATAPDERWTTDLCRVWSGRDDWAAFMLATLELMLLFAFVAGIARRWRYGIVLLLHAVSTLSPWLQYSPPFEGANLLFFAAWPMLAARVALYLLLDSDVYIFRSSLPST